MRQSTELSNLVAKHLQGQVPPSVVNEFNKLIVKMRKDESTIADAVDKFEAIHNPQVGAVNLNDEILKGKLSFEI
jgi:rRNA-processing protein FCF1